MPTILAFQVRPAKDAGRVFEIEGASGQRRPAFRGVPLETVELLAFQSLTLDKYAVSYGIAGLGALVLANCTA